MISIVKDVIGETQSYDQDVTLRVVQGKRTRGRSQRPNYALQPGNGTKVQKPTEVQADVQRLLGPGRNNFHPVSCLEHFLLVK